MRQPRPGVRPHLGSVLLVWMVLGLLGGCAAGHPYGIAPSRNSPSCGDAEALLAPFLSSPSPAEFVALQQRVDMPGLVARLDDWSAVRLGALGPVREDAAGVLNHKRASFLVTATERYGVAKAEVFALFILHSAHDDDLKEVLALLARDRRLGETLGRMSTVREELARRGLKLSDAPDRDFELGDLARGACRAGTDLLDSSPLSNGSGGLALSTMRGQLPPPYQRALDEVWRVEASQHFAPGNVVRGSFDELTFGVPLGLYGLAAGVGHGASSLSQGEYEQAVRELTPAALLVGLYAGGTSAPYLSEARSATGTAWEVARRLEARLGVEGLREVARYIEAHREAGRFVAAGGADAAAALHEAQGDVARAQAWLSQAKPQRSGPGTALVSSGKNLDLALRVDEPAGFTQEVVRAKLEWEELDSSGPRLSGNVAVLEKQRPALDAPPPGAHGNPLWGEYVSYYESRVAELKQGRAVKPPLAWAGYEPMRGLFARGLAFERAMVEVLRADAALPRAKRRFLGDFDKPRVESCVGVKKPDTNIRFADVLIIEEGEHVGSSPRVETFSFKSRDLSLLERDELVAQMRMDANDALRYYGGTLNIRRPSLNLRETQVRIQRVRLVYEGGELKPRNAKTLRTAMSRVEEMCKEVEVLFQ